MFLVDGHIFLTLLGAEVNQLLDAKFVLVPSVQLVKILYHKRQSNLQTSREPLRERDWAPIRAAMSVQVERTGSGEFSERCAKFQEILGGTVWRYSRRRGLWDHCDCDRGSASIESDNNARWRCESRQEIEAVIYELESAATLVSVLQRRGSVESYSAFHFLGSNTSELAVHMWLTWDRLERGAI